MSFIEDTKVRKPSQLANKPIPDDHDVFTLEDFSAGDLKGMTWADLKALVEEKANKVTSFSSPPNDNNYPSEKLVFDTIEDLSFAGETLSKADWESPCFVKNSPTTASIKAGTKVVAGEKTIEFSTNTPIIMPALTAGEDYSIWVHKDGTIEAVHDPYENPADVADALKVGGFHFSLTPSGEAPTGNKTEADMEQIRGINAHSIWDLKWRWANGQPRGMLFYAGVWVDIYLLNAEHITYGTSRAGQWIAGGSASSGRQIPKIPLRYGGDGNTNYGKFTWFQAGEVARSHGKKLIPYQTFPSLAYGVSEGKSSSTDGYEVTAGAIEHYPHLLSACGMEQAAGVQRIWGADIIGPVGTGWQDLADGRGQIYGTSAAPVGALLGGSRANGSSAGSRCSYWNYQVWYSSSSVGGRCAGDHLQAP